MKSRQAKRLPAKSTRRSRAIPQQLDVTFDQKPTKIKEFAPKTKAQADYVKAINSNCLVFAIGPAGTGKTFVAAEMAVKMFLGGEIDNIIITRPAVEAGEELGFLPGELDEKMAPWFAPVRIEFEKRMGKGQIEGLIKSERIKVIPLAHMRGHTFERSFVLLDEAQNTSVTQMKMFLTRIGEDSKVIVDGDYSQVDLPRGQVSGLEDAVERLMGRKNIAVVTFDKGDIVRSGIVREILDAYAS